MAGLAAGGWLLSGMAVAQAPAPPPPPRVLQDLAPAEPPRLSPGLEGPPIAPSPVAPGAPDVPVLGVEITGNAALPDARLAPLVQGLAGRTVSQAEIEAARIALLTAYRNAGFPFLSVVATGEIRPGGVQLRYVIQEGRIAQVRLAGDIGPAGTQVLRFLRGAMTPGAATVSRIERALLLAGDVPGVSVRGVLRPLEGGAAGELELVGEVQRRAFSGLVSADNRGFQLTGPVQFLALAQANAFTSLGERLEAAFFTSAQAESLFGQASGEFFLGGSGLRVRLYAGAGRTLPTGQLADIGYAGYTQTAGAALSYPVIRSRSANLTAGLQFDVYEALVETGRPQPVRNSRDSLRVLRAGADVQRLDSWLPLAAPATTLATLRVHQGLATLGATRTEGLPGPSRRGSTSGFTKLTGEIQRIQPILRLNEDMVFSLQAGLAGQWSNDVLPAAEKFFLGGNRLGRGFYTGQVSGDRALVASVEAQLDVRLPAFSVSPEGREPIEVNPAAQFYLFYDWGRTWENLADDPDRRAISYGGGVRTALSPEVSVDVEVVRRVTRRVDAGGDAVPRLSNIAGFARVLVRF